VSDWSAIRKPRRRGFPTALCYRFERSVTSGRLSEEEIAEAKEAASYRYNLGSPDDDESPDWSEGDRNAAENTADDNWDETAGDSDT
jgi:hypothetical protein